MSENKINPIYTERKYTLTSDEINKIDDPNVLAEKMDKIMKANEIAAGEIENESERNFVEEVEDEIAGFQLDLITLQSMEENFVRADDNQIKELIKKELLETKKAIFEKIDSYIVKLRNENYVNMDQQRQLIEIRNKVFQIRSEDSKFSIAA